MWTDTTENSLKQLVSMRIPYPDIAARLKTSVGAVCAKVHRLGIGLGPKSQQTNWHKARMAAEDLEPSTDPAFLAIMRAQRQEALDHQVRLRLEDAEDHQCSYVIGEPTDRYVCGRERAAGSSYCQRHLERCGSVRDLAWRERQSESIRRHWHEHGSTFTRSGKNPSRFGHGCKTTENSFYVDVRTLETNDVNLTATLEQATECPG